MATSASLTDVRSGARRGFGKPPPQGLPEKPSELGLRAPQAPSRLWVPPTASRELVERRREYEAQMIHMLQMKHVMDEFNTLLKEIDPYLELVKAMENIEPGFALRPGFWHVIRHNPGAPPSIMTIQGPNGEYVEPTHQIFDMLKKNDLWDSRSLKEENRRRAKLEEAEKKRIEVERDERRQEILEKYQAATRTQVSMLPGWSQNVAGRRGRSKE